MSNVNVTVVVHHPVIAAWSLPGGMVFRWTLRRREAVEALAIALCPARTGALKASINGVYRPRARNHVHMEVHAGNEIAEYARWVHEGTRAVISSPYGRQMFLNPAYGGHPAHREWFVRGQGLRSGKGAQPFLRTALERVMRREI